ncbi:TIGR03085 family metal-binding protein [Nocardia sp. NPDC050413]|uniref:TIGR03085 family metal-binding protein n=1 Tax=Nocardia sp. NPDC050413 TaxID=3155784 RepID=UPI003403D6F5
MSLAQRERHALVRSALAAGAEAPTLCGTWTVYDLAAHLVVRERRPDAALGILLKPMTGYLDRQQAKIRQRPFPVLAEQIRTGPPLWSPLRPVDAVVNLTEMFIHHEDIRRGEPGWEPRQLDDADEQRLWRALRAIARANYRKSPAPLVLATPSGERITAHAGTGDAVVLTGPPSELLLHAFGRDEVRIEASGPDADVRAVLATDRSV